jgi:hypothetical protein
LCLLQSGNNCNECPFITCNNHPCFYLALQCAMQGYRDRVGTKAAAR